jgi:hypothetical protein
MYQRRIKEDSKNVLCKTVLSLPLPVEAGDHDGFVLGSEVCVADVAPHHKQPPELPHRVRADPMPPMTPMPDAIGSLELEK